VNIEEYGSLALTIIFWVVLFSYWAGFVLFIVGKSSVRELPNGIPLVFIPLAAWFQFVRQKLDSLRRQRIAAFLKLADDLWMRKDRINGFLPRWPRR
jgi:hypothetical protein